MLLDLGADPTTTNNAGRTAASLAEMKGFKMIADVCTYVASQVEASKSKSIGNVAARALLVKQAASNFKGGVNLANEKVRFDEDCPIKVASSATKVQALVRGHSTRNVLKAVQQKVEETPPSQLGSLAAQALINRNFTKRLKQSIAPKTRVGFAEFQSMQPAEQREEATEAEEAPAIGGGSPPPNKKKVCALSAPENEAGPLNPSTPTPTLSRRSIPRRRPTRYHRRQSRRPRPTCRRRRRA